MHQPIEVDLVDVLRRHATVLTAKGIPPNKPPGVPCEETAKLLREAAKAIEALRVLHWGMKEEPCAKT